MKKISINQVKSEDNIPVRVRGEAEKAMLEAIKLVSIANQIFETSDGFDWSTIEKSFNIK